MDYEKRKANKLGKFIHSFLELVVWHVNFSRFYTKKKKKIFERIERERKRKGQSLRKSVMKNFIFPSLQFTVENGSHFIL